MKFLCKIGIHSWICDRIANLIDLQRIYDIENMPVFKFKKTRYTVKVKHCDRCKKLKVITPNIHIKNE